MDKDKYKNEIEKVDHNLTPVQETRTKNVIGMFDTVSTAPTAVPYNWQDQVKIYVNGSTYRLYWYDTNANTWHYVTATA